VLWRLAFVRHVAIEKIGPCFRKILSVSGEMNMLKKCAWIKGIVNPVPDKRHGVTAIPGAGVCDKAVGTDEERIEIRAARLTNTRCRFHVILAILMLLERDRRISFHDL